MNVEEASYNAGIHENLKCPQCGWEWWKAVVVFDKETDDTCAYGNEIQCDRCGHWDGVLQLTGRALPQADV